MLHMITICVRPYDIMRSEAACLNFLKAMWEFHKQNGEHGGEPMAKSGFDRSMSSMAWRESAFLFMKCQAVHLA